MRKPLHPLFEHLEGVLPAGADALDLGCGVGHGTLFLLERGFRVTAVDAESRALDILRSRVSSAHRVSLIASRFEDFEPPPCDLVLAFFSLFFMPAEAFKTFWQKLVAAMRPGGVFAGQFLGVNDEWRDRGYSTFTSAEVRRLLAGLETLYYEEVERDGETALGTPKHWHVFHVIARKP
ncbi:MAG TPA: class I SAM-dependent methyltransferase [Fimbriimonadaceae bacterium]|nr:class I SAM-dependent methyltransferase [Fimbriimonadaceae bacterium]